MHLSSCSSLIPDVSAACMDCSPLVQTEQNDLRINFTYHFWHPLILSSVKRKEFIMRRWMEEGKKRKGQEQMQKSS